MNEDSSANVALRNVRQPLADTYGEKHPVQASAVAWGAIFAGAAGAAALSLILLILGTGLGFSSVSPYSGRGAGAVTLGVSTVLWLTFTQLAASGMGGYLAGRLRTRWAAVHADEVYFRDTAHGFLSWAVASVLTAAFLTSAVGSIVGESAKIGAAAGGGAATAAVSAAMPSGATLPDSSNSAGPMGYFIDSMFRKSPGVTRSTAGSDPASGPDAQASGVNSAESAGNRGNSAEVARIFAFALQSGALSPEDTQYAGSLISQRTGMPSADAEKKVAQTFTQIQEKAKALETTARDAADKARRGASLAALWLFVALLAGAFVASFCATLGGRLRDI